MGKNGRSPHRGPQGFEPGDQGLLRHTASGEQVVQPVEEVTEDRMVSGEQRCGQESDDEHKILPGAGYLALWWVADGRYPDVGEGRRRLAHLERFGPTPYAFNFLRPFEADANATPLAELGDARADPETYRLSG